MPKPPLLIVGASSRAAAFSALAAGFEPLCVDLFADVDLHERCRVLSADHYPDDLPALAKQFPAAPWMYTGALENHPQIIEEISQRRPLWGNAPKVLSAVRSPEQLAEYLSGPQWRFPPWQRAAPRGQPGTWLIKADRSAGGAQIKIWDERLVPMPQRSGWYFQQHVAGVPCAAVYVADGHAARLLGVTEQLVGTSWSGASGFRYAGSLGPLQLSEDQRDQFAELGQQLVSRFRLVGLFGVDVVIEGDARWVIEINPRFTASIEVLERAGRFSAVACHAAACRDGMLAAEPHFANDIHGKVILYARGDVTVPAALTAMALEENQRLAAPAVADIPAPNTHLRGGWPVMTLLAQAADRTALVAALQGQAARWQRLLGEAR
jgi:predicted ATP-grasp superfamily ATP-dependent carboligase